MDIVANTVEFFTHYLEIGGPLLGFIIVILESFIPPLPLGVFVALNCNAFGLLFGIIISWIATIVGCVLSYLLFNALSNKVIFKLLNQKNKEKVWKASLKFQKVSLSGLVLLIALPFTPAFLINIVAGVAGISKKKFIAALLIGKVSTISFWGIVGKSFIESVTDIKAIIFLLIALTVTYVISKIVSRKMHIE